MRLTDYLSRDRVAVLDATDKDDALRQVLALMAASNSIADPEAFRSAIWEREEVLPTGIGLGIGVPHVRCKAVRDPVAALAVLQDGVVYGSLDGLPVRLVLMIGMPENTHREYLDYLAKATALFKNDAFRKRAFESRTADALWRVIASV